jgi:hypothetical protein
MTPDPQKRAAVASIRNELESSRDSRIWTDYVNALRLVSQVVFTRSSGFVLELIQNAEDAGQGLSGKGNISISVDRQRLKFVHNGRPLTIPISGLSVGFAPLRNRSVALCRNKGERLFSNWKADLAHARSASYRIVLEDKRRLRISRKRRRHRIPKTTGNYAFCITR